MTNEGDVQRYNIIVLGYRMGLRPDNLRRLHLAMVNLGTLANGQKVLTLVIGNMKNMRGKLSKINVALFRQQVIQAAHPEFCASAAFERQCELLSRAQAPGNGPNYLFRTSRYRQKTLGSTQTTQNTYDGATKWVRESVFMSQLTWKDVASRVAMTTLANDPNGPTFKVLLVPVPINDDGLEPLAPALDVTMNTLDVPNRVTNDDAHHPLTPTSVGTANALNTDSVTNEDADPTIKVLPVLVPINNDSLEPLAPALDVTMNTSVLELVRGPWCRVRNKNVVTLVPRLCVLAIFKFRERLHYPPCPPK